MGDFQFWLYIIIGAVYLLSRFFKKSVQRPDEASEVEPDKPVRRFEPPVAKPNVPSKTLTFEELLREITEGKTESQPTAQRPEYTNYDENLEEEEQDLEDVDYDYKKDKVATAYEDAKQHAFRRSSLEETMSIKDTDITFGKFKEFERQEQSNVVDRYLGDLYDADSLKKAIVLNEILQRKF